MNKLFYIDTNADLRQLEERASIFKARAEFTLRYCAERGWSANIEELSWKQIMEIREQAGWKNPVVEEAP